MYQFGAPPPAPATATPATGSKPLPPGPKIPPRIQSQILSALTSSRLTIVVGPTGCGKSTQVPALLLESFPPPSSVLCTQPRRLAVVAVSRRVSEERGTALGSEVGYHVGRNRRTMTDGSTRLLFTTCGILLEQLRASGVDALSPHACVVLDECHERSPESDLVLSILRSIMRMHPRLRTRLVLMSASFDHGRYREYFEDVPGCEDSRAVNLESGEAFRNMHERVSVRYVDEVAQMLRGREAEDYGPGEREDYGSVERELRLYPEDVLSGLDKGRSLSQDIVELVESLVSYLHGTEPLDGVFMVFAPTYRHLEQIYFKLLHGDARVGEMMVKIDVLHSSVDIEDCLRTMSASPDESIHGGPLRKVLLASAIADSSVTIPNVTVVIDLCRSLEVTWDRDTRSSTARTVWASQSVCDQRKGRTGRTCPGSVYRLIDRGFYINRLDAWDRPQISASSCRGECLSLLCSVDGAGLSADPAALLGRCLDPPPPAVVQDALQYLVDMGACEVVARGKRRVRHVPTKFGALVTALPFGVTDSASVVDGGRLGLLHETLALRAICSHRPTPIVHRFGQDEENAENLGLYLPGVRASDPRAAEMANLSAYMYWDAHWRAERDGERQRSFEGGDDALGDIHARTAEEDRRHAAWCEAHKINPASVLSVAEMVDAALDALFHARHEPPWLRCNAPTSPPLAEPTGAAGRIRRSGRRRTDGHATARLRRREIA